MCMQSWKFGTDNNNLNSEFVDTGAGVISGMTQPAQRPGQTITGPKD